MRWFVWLSRLNSGLRLRVPTVPSASSIALVAASHPFPLNPIASILMSPVGETSIMICFFMILETGCDDLNGPV